MDHFSNPHIGHLARLWAKHGTCRCLIACGPPHSPHPPPGKHPAFSFSRWGDWVFERVGPPSRSQGHFGAGIPTHVFCIFNLTACSVKRLLSLVVRTWASEPDGLMGLSMVAFGAAWGMALSGGVCLYCSCCCSRVCVRGGGEGPLMTARDPLSPLPLPGKGLRQIASLWRVSPSTKWG